MIRFTWLQFRVQARVALAALAAVALVLAVTGPHLAHLYDISALATCRRHGACGSLASNYNVLYKAGHVVLYAVPALIGMFWARRCSPASWRPEPSGWPGPRPLPAAAGWPPSSA